jgi:hypothetical protein
MTDEKSSGSARQRDQLQVVYDEVERQFFTLFSEENKDKAMDFIGELAEIGKGSVKFAMDLLGELATEMTSVESFQVIPKPPMELDVQIRCKKDRTFPMKRALAPMVDLEAVYINKKLSFGALIDKNQKGLEVNIREGVAFRVNLGPLFGIRVVELKGKGLLKHDDKNQLVLVTTVPLPGMDPVTITIPFKYLFGQGNKK